MGAEYNNCFGCDVCDKTIQTNRIGQTEIINLIKKYNRKLTIRETALTLTGSRYSDVFEKKLFSLKGFGSLNNWTIDDIKAAVNQLEKEKIIKIPTRGLYKNRLQLFFFHSLKAFLSCSSHNPKSPSTIPSKVSQGLSFFNR